MKKSVKSLAKKSNSVLNIFRKTLDQLNGINAEIAKEIDLREKEKYNLDVELLDLSKTSSDNGKMIEKIEDFLA